VTALNLIRAGQIEAGEDDAGLVLSPEVGENVSTCEVTVGQSGFTNLLDSGLHTWDELAEQPVGVERGRARDGILATDMYSTNWSMRNTSGTSYW
jgi:hypothetical protein